MATVTPAEHSETQKIEIGGNTLSVLVIGIALFALAYGAFTHLSRRIDNLGAKIEQQAARTDTKIDKLDAKIDTVATELRAEMKRYSERTDDKIDRLTEKINELLIAQTRGK